MLGNGFLYAGSSGVVRALGLDVLDRQNFTLPASGPAVVPRRGWLGMGSADLSGTTSGTRGSLTWMTSTDRVATLHGGRATVDGHRPTPPIASTGGSPGVVRRSGFDTPISFTWSGQDDEAAAPSYDVQ
jgi:hypothetical protein